MKKTLFTKGFTLIELLVVISIIAILAGIALPVFSTVKEKGNQTADLANGKQIGLALRLYSTDNNGRFPKNQPDANGQENVTATGVALANANAAFRYLCPTYVSTEKTFYLNNSGWTPNLPDENTAAANALIAGENQFAYVIGITDSSNPSFPLVADGFGTVAGIYPIVGNEGDRGFVWKGKKAIVIRADASGAVENVAQGGANAGRVLGQINGASANIFATSAGWLSASQVPVNPIAP